MWFQIEMFGLLKFGLLGGLLKFGSCGTGKKKKFFPCQVFSVHALRTSGDVVLCVRQGVSAMRAMFLEVVREGCWTCIRGLLIQGPLYYGLYLAVTRA